MRLDSQNIVSNAIGFDTVITYPRYRSNNFYVAAGVGIFSTTLQGGERVNAHVGVGMEVGKIIVSVDAYGSDSDPLYTLNAGVHF